MRHLEDPILMVFYLSRLDIHAWRKAHGQRIGSCFAAKLWSWGWPKIDQDPVSGRSIAAKTPDFFAMSNLTILQVSASNRAAGFPKIFDRGAFYGHLSIPPLTITILPINALVSFLRIGPRD